MMASISAIETFGTVDGPGIRTVVFFNGCNLRCIYCHNPEMWVKSKDNTTVDELVEKILKNKDYFGESGGVTFSGGEPLLHSDFIIEVSKKLKLHNIIIALYTTGVGLGDYEELLKYIDLIILDIKHTTLDGFKKITQTDKYQENKKFIEIANKLNKKFWIRQVIVPGIMDNEEYLISLKEYIKQIKNIERIEFLPYHKLGREKFIKLGIPYPCENIPEMDKEKCDQLYKNFIKL